MPNLRHLRGKGSAGKIAGGGSAVLLAGLAVWWMSSQTPPAVHIPTPVLPSPNAFDTFLTASSQLLESKKIDNAMYSPEGAKTAGFPIPTLSDRDKLMAENATALASLREGLDQPYWNPPARSFYTLMPYYAKFRALARFLAVDAGVHAAKGEYAAAARSSLDAMTMGAQIPHGSTLIGGLVGIACQGIGRKPMWQVVEHLDASEAKEAAQRVEKIRGNEFSYAETLQEEKWACQASILEIFRSRNPARTLSNGVGLGTNGLLNNPAIGGASSLYYLAYSKRRIMDDYTGHINAVIARAREPYSASRSTVPVPYDPFVWAIVPVYEQADMKWTEKWTQNGLLEITAALRAFRMRHGKYPDSLAQLVPEVLHSLPTDPFTAGQPFCYKPSGNSYLLYSVGPDGKDDGGRMIDTGPSPAGGTNERYLVKPESNGDIVAGKNIW
jgi:hypothetical protein